ncbi:MAG: hypothetical protein ACE5NP_13965 [Anaerolineae bacterium]
MARCLYGGMLLVFVAIAIALGAVVYRGGMAMFDSILHSPISTLYCLLPLALVALTGAIGLWYLLRSLKLNLRDREVSIERARTDFAPTERGFAPRLIEGKVVNPNVVPSAVTPLEAAEQPGEISEERRLAGVLGWHLSNVPPGRAVRLPRQRHSVLPIPEPKPSPWEVSHVERLLLEAGETSEE